ncbi:MAG TPA: glutathione S-transferase family protein, partial [Rhodobacterales bacterium]|nr:glutathione S-transferase family protein [Rhodobacterales bacterium]
TLLVDRRTRAQKSASYRRLNPRGLIPVLETPEGPVFETAAILLWLADGAHRLAPPPDSPARGAFLSWLFAFSNGLHAELRALFYPDTIAGPEPDAFTERTRARVAEMLDLAETHAGAGHRWFAAPEPSVLDLYMAVMLRWLALYPVGDTGWFTLTRWPALHALAARIEARPAALRAAEAEGLGPTPFSAPHYPNPPEGSAT